MRSLTLLLICAAVLLAGAGPAHACSLAPSEPRDQVARADAAIFVEVTGKAEEAGGESGDSSRYGYRYEVRIVRSYKGSLTGSTVVVAAADGASCGVELDVGSRVGLLLSGEGPPYGIGLASLISEQELERATAPFPRLTGSGPVALLVGGRYGTASLMALDRRGRVLAYGYGRPGYALAVCPGSDRYVQAERGGIGVYRTRDLRRIGRRPAPDEAIDRLRCLDPAARRVAAFVRADDDASGQGRLFVSRAGDFRTLQRGRATAAALSDDRASSPGES